jgi:hypothetical protein
MGEGERKLIQSIIKQFRERFRLFFTFVLSASSMPAIYLLRVPQACGLFCATCPFGGFCIIALPIIIGAALFTKSSKKVRAWAKALTNHTNTK